MAFVQTIREKGRGHGIEIIPIGTLWKLSSNSRDYSDASFSNYFLFGVSCYFSFLIATSGFISVHRQTKVYGTGWMVSSSIQYAVPWQEHSSQPKICAYFSGKFKGPEINYATYDKELLDVWNTIDSLKSISALLWIHYWTNNQAVPQFLKQKTKRLIEKNLRRIWWVMGLETEMASGFTNHCADFLNRNGQWQWSTSSR